MKPTLEQIKTDESVWPEGAEYYTPKDNKFHDDPPRAHIWNYITRPAKAFVPEVGDHLEVTWGDKAVWHECVILPSGKIAILGYVNEVRKIDKLDCIEFRPIKSELDLFIAKSREVTNANKDDAVTNDLFNDMFEAGCRYTTVSSKLEKEL